MNGIDVSVIMPCYNEEGVIYDVLSCLTDELAKTKHSFEIIFCDNGSTDNSRIIASQFPVHTINSVSRTVAGVRNDGVAVAKGKMFIFLDSDIVVGRDWGEVVAEVFEMVVGSGVIVGSHPTFPDTVSPILRSWYEAISNDMRSTHMGTGHMIISTENFHRIGRFDDSLVSGEDYDFCAKAKQLGMSIVTEPRLLVCHVGYPANLLDFAKREMWHGEGDFRHLKSMLKSKVALTALLFSLSLIVSFFMLFVNITTAQVFFIVALGVAIATQYYKFGSASLWITICRSFISCIYLFSRSASLPMIMSKKLKFLFS
ncbi:MAG: glycosyltransferase [Desulfobulbaceae bacterium]|nr:MAG: glycosyltransferase [Desulfobulbaceae bacterium]